MLRLSWYFELDLNWQRAIEDENPAGLPNLDLINRNGHSLTWERYHEYEDIESYLKYLEETFPEFVTLTEFGRTTEGRPLKAIRLHQESGRADKKTILIDAGEYIDLIHLS